MSKPDKSILISTFESTTCIVVHIVSNECTQYHNLYQLFKNKLDEKLFEYLLIYDDNSNKMKERVQELYISIFDYWKEKDS